MSATFFSLTNGYIDYMIDVMNHVDSAAGGTFNRLIDLHGKSNDFYLFKILRAHILPLTNCAFNKSGDKFITGSYDRTCKVWNTITGDELLTLEGHRNVV